jgi:hypothetical protein
MTGALILIVIGLLAVLGWLVRDFLQWAERLNQGPPQ